jgi:hypothetical protein
MMSGEVEVTEMRGEAGQPIRLGFLSEGSFFGEGPMLEAGGVGGLFLRTRTVRAVTVSAAVNCPPAQLTHHTRRAPTVLFHLLGVVPPHILLS